jgi:26S proteasome regulatory subunit N2
VAVVCVVQVLRSLVKLYHECPVPDYVNMSRCLIFLDDPQELAKILESLIRSGNDDDTLLAFQIAFELCDNATQSFLENVRKLLPPPSQATSTDASSAAPVVPKPEDATDKTPLLSADAMDVDRPQQQQQQQDAPFDKTLKTLHRILTGEPTIDLYLQFLYRNNHTDLGVLKALKAAFEPRVSILHTATIVSNALMHAGTTRDTFLRDNLEWLAKAINWSKFSTTAGLGVIHRGHLNEAMKVLEPYLPKPGNPTSPYTEGGSLYALGIIHANHGTGSGHAATQYLLQQLRDNMANETVVHGACLGLGVTAMASGNTAILDELMNILYSQDNAVAGEAAGYGIGLVMLGTAHEKALELLNHARDTQHEKIIRGIAIGLAHMYYGREEEADAMIEQLCSDKDPILRYGGMFMIGLAYAGTNNNHAIKKLLHVAVSDVNDDVRRAAVMMLGFVNFRQPDQVPKLVSLLSESYNPAVRYGACLAVGIACAGTGMKEAYDMLLPMAKNDAVDTVRQGALIALSMVFIQINNPHSAEIRKLFRERVEDKHETVMCKMGAILATGIIDAGGRNVTLSLKSRAGHRNMQAVVGIAMFLQYWYWYPLTHFISLAFTPTAVIGLNKDLRMPKMQFRSNAAPSTFAYPPEVKPPEENKNKKVEKIELSAAKRAKARAGAAAAAASKDAMDVDQPQTKSATGTTSDKMDVDSADKKPEAEKKAEPEPTFEVLENPARVTRAQLKFISFDVDPRYRPVTEGVMGVVMLKDLKPGEEEQIITEGVPALGSAAEEAEPAPPEPFEFEG